MRFFVAIISVFVFQGCLSEIKPRSKSGSTEGAQEPFKKQLFSLTSQEQLGPCADKNLGEIFFIVTNKEFWTCESSGSWAQLNLAGPAGPAGAAGPAGLPGQKGEAGTVVSEGSIESSMIADQSVTPDKWSGAESIATGLNIASGGCGVAAMVTLDPGVDYTNIKARDYFVDKSGTELQIIGVDASANTLYLNGTCDEVGSNETGIVRYALRNSDFGNIGLYSPSTSQPNDGFRVDASQYGGVGLNGLNRSVSILDGNNYSRAMSANSVVTVLSGVTDGGYSIGIRTRAVVQGLGTMQTATGINSWAGHETGSTAHINTAHGGIFAVRAGTGTITNAFGVYVGNVNANGGNEFGFYQQEADPNYFAGNLGIGDNSPTAALDIASDTIRLRDPKSPASAGDTCNQGEIVWDASFVYICVAADTWKRAALSTWP